MKTYCTRPDCLRPVNVFADLDDKATLKTVQQKYCTTCGMPQILIGRYLPIRLLGKGGFGTAFLAVDRYTPTNRQCVVKQFQPSGNLTPSQLQIAQELFEREALALEKLGVQHPQIPNLLAFFELDVPNTRHQKSDQFFYLVQEFIDGQTMEEELTQKGSFSQSEALIVLGEVLKILKFVHDFGSIHRDIKPSNIMRARSGQIYLLDFGAVKDVTTGKSGNQTNSSTGIYSMGFAPPEQMSGGVVYPATDLYALAVTGLTLLTGKQPTELYDAYRNSWNWRSHAQVSDSLARILDKMLEATPSQRFQSADEVLAALNRPLGMTSSSGKSRQPVGTPSQPQVQMSSSTSMQQSVPPSPSVSRPQGAMKASGSSQGSAGSPNVSTFKIVTGAAFTGFEFGIGAIAIFSLLGITPISLGVILVISLGLIVAQIRGILEGSDLPILAVLTLVAAIAFEMFGNFSLLSALQGLANPYVAIAFIAVMAGLMFVAISILFLLVYRVISSFI
ncbi:MAG: protein kinase domain-containing protein [Elainellaceae cyanobacterium]